MDKKFVFHTDAGHGWIAVKRTLLVELNILDKITSYSYQKGATVYLEEDCDATTFCNAYEAKYGKVPEFKSSYQNYSRIRSYFGFTKEGRNI